MVKVGVPVPKTVILPSYEMPTDTKGESFSNLAYPLDWENIFNYVGFPGLHETLCRWWMEECV
jgi:hypothetical protein